MNIIKKWELKGRVVGSCAVLTSHEAGVSGEVDGRADGLLWSLVLIFSCHVCDQELIGLRF